MCWKNLWMGLAFSLFGGILSAASGDLDVPSPEAAPINCPDDDASATAAVQDHPCEATWTATGEAVFLTRSSPAANVLAFDALAGAPLLDASSLDLGTLTGIDLTLARRVGDWGTLEIRYLGADEWHASGSTPTTPGGLVQINTAIPLSVDAGTSLASNLSSELHSIEANGRYALRPGWDVLVGFRAVHLDEQLQLRLTDVSIPFTYTAEARNRLYGFQLGGHAPLWDRGERFALGATGKAGLFADCAAQDSSAPNGAVVLPAGGRNNVAAFLGEIDVAAQFRFWEHAAVLAGYRLLWIDGVSLAPDQVPVTEFVTGTGLATASEAFYHGAFAGLQLAW